MKFFATYLDQHDGLPNKKFKVTKRKSEKAQINDLDLLSNDATKK